MNPKFVVEAKLPPSPPPSPLKGEGAGKGEGATEKFRMNRRKMGMTIFIALVLILAMGHPFVWAGVSSPYGEIVIDNVPLGEEINMRELASIAYRARNTGDTPVLMLLSVVGQDPGEIVKEGYEKIPDLSWVRLSQTEVPLAPGQEAVADVYISLPNLPQHLGKKYQAYIWARAIPAEETGYMSVVAGVKSRLLINVSPIPLSREQRKKVSELKASLGFQLVPDRIELKAVPLGKKLNVKETFKKSFKLINPNDHELKFKISLIERRNTLIRVPEGWEDPPLDKNYVDVEPKEIMVPASSIEELQATVNFPRKKELEGKRYVFVVEVVLKNFDVPVTFHGRILVETEGERQ